MEPQFPYGQASTKDDATYINYAPPTDSVAAEAPATAKGAAAHGRHGGHWMHLLMCAPMLLIVGYLVITGKAGGGSIIYAVGCMVMMGVMMALMGRGSNGGDSGGHAGHHH
jgi:hypothetical protein